MKKNANTMDIIREAILDIKTRFDWTPNEVFHDFVKKVFEYAWPNDKWPYVK